MVLCLARWTGALANACCTCVKGSGWILQVGVLHISGCLPQHSAFDLDGAEMNFEFEFS
jgi:hypothetical protein